MWRLAPPFNEVCAAHANCICGSALFFESTSETMTLRIRSGQHSDVEACVKILCAWNDEHEWLTPLSERPELLAFWREYFEKTSVWVAQIDDRIVGFCVRDDDNLGALYVAADMRRAGIGKQLLDRAKADRDWITVWAYEKNTEALRFYRREGLVEVSRDVEEGSELVDIEHRWVKPG